MKKSDYIITIILKIGNTIVVITGYRKVLFINNYSLVI